MFHLLLSLRFIQLNPTWEEQGENQLNGLRKVDDFTQQWGGMQGEWLKSGRLADLSNNCTKFANVLP
jgi:hypothetical protein